MSRSVRVVGDAGVNRVQTVRNVAQSRGAAMLNAGRWWLGLTGLFMAASVVPETLRNYRKWHSALSLDPSAADFWRTEFYLDLLRITAELLVAAAIFFFLRPRAGESDVAPRS
jgi:hypothetical protein